jgi:cytochrome c oxidase subunit 2
MRPGKVRVMSAVAAVLILTTLLIPAAWCASQEEQVIQVTAKKFEYSPQEITVKKGIPVVLEFRSLDRLHGFNCPGLKIRTDIPPNKTTTLRFVPEKAGVFSFHCDVFCGSGHGSMTGTIIVKE